MVQSLWRQGRRRQATFWFYVFQVRTLPWALADKAGDGAAALRSSLNDELGSLVNPWVGSDVVAWREIVGRAISYERRLPLPAERPADLDAGAWLRMVETARAAYAAEMRSAFGELTPEAHAAARRSAGMPVGPLDRPGPSLPDGWR